MTSGPTSPHVGDTLAARPVPPLRVGASECLLGSPVRYDGSQKGSSFPRTLLDDLFEFVGVCPEVAAGMGVPRKPIRLVAPADEPGSIDATPRAVEPGSGRDFTDEIAAVYGDTAPLIDGLHGFIFMKNSPSCGVYRVKVYSGNGMPRTHGRGVYAAAVMAAHPTLPVEESGRLFDSVLRENFATRVFAHAHWRALQAQGLSAARLVAFHSRYKYLLLAHSVTAYKSAGRILSDLKGDLPQIAASYFDTLMTGLASPATAGGHANVLSHLQGYFKRVLDAHDRQELAGLIDDYRCGRQPLMAVLTLLKHHLRKHHDPYLDAQVYLEPHPPAAALRRSL